MAADCLIGLLVNIYTASHTVTSNYPIRVTNKQTESGVSYLLGRQS